MPRRRPERASPADGGGRGKRGRRVTGGGPFDLFEKPSFVEDPGGSGLAELRRIQPYQADKTYVCPGCNQEIWRGVGHVVIVPVNDPGGRRHWHTPCWEHRANRRPTGR